MHALEQIKTDMAITRMTLKVIEEETKGREFTVKELHQNPRGYIISGASMSALIRRGLVKMVGLRPSTYKRTINVDGYDIEVDVPTEVKVYKQIHDYEWYQNIMLKTLTNIVMR